MPDYYENSRKRVADFLLGFFGGVVGNTVLGIILSMGISMFNFINNKTILTAISSLFLAIIIAANVVLIIYSFKKKRRYIAIGMISGYFLPFLILGACFMILSSM